MKQQEAAQQQGQGKGSGSLRAVMPETAAIVDELRQALGREWADRLVLGGKQGRGTFRCVEQCPDGVQREFGSIRPLRGGHGAH